MFKNNKSLGDGIDKEDNIFPPVERTNLSDQMLYGFISDAKFWKCKNWEVRQNLTFWKTKLLSKISSNVFFLIQERNM